MQSYYPNKLINSVYVNTLNSSKVFYLPVVSTIPPGTLLYIKDICGNAANSSIILSTVSYFDTIEGKASYTSTFSNITSPSYSILNTNYASVLLMPDGKTNWMVLQNNINNPIYGRTGYSSFLYTYFYNLIVAGSARPAQYGADASYTSRRGPGYNGWFYPYSQTNISSIDFTNYAPSNTTDLPIIPAAAQSTNWGFGAQGYIYSASNTTIQFRTIMNDGMVVLYNNSTVVSNWADTTTNITRITPRLPLSTGYNPIKIWYYCNSNINRALFSWAIPGSASGAGPYVSNGTGIMYYNESSKYWDRVI